MWTLNVLVLVGLNQNSVIYEREAMTRNKPDIVVTIWQKSSQDINGKYT